MFKKLLAILVLLISVFAYGMGAGQEVKKSDSILILSIPEITVSGILLSKINLPFQVMTSEEIESHGFMTPADALHHLPGVSLSRDGTWPTSVNIRGFSESKLLFLSNGDRMQTATDIAGALSSVDMDAIERIEVVKGAGSVLFGTGALGGVVNFVPRRPGYSNEFRTSGRYSTGLQSVNGLFHNSLRVNLSNDDWYLGITGSLRQAQNTNTPEGEITNSQFNDASFGLLGGVKYSDNQEFLVNYSHFRAWDVGLPGGSAFPATAQVRYTGFERNHLSGEYLFTDLSHNIRLLSVKAYTQSIRRDVENVVTPVVAIFPGSLNTTSGLRTAADLYFNDYHTMTVGVETWRRDQRTTRVRINTANDTIFSGEQPTPNASVLDAGIFGQYKWVLDPGRWTLNTGLRMDFIRTENDTAFREVFRYRLTNGQRIEMPHNRTILFNKNTANEYAYSAHADIMFEPTRRQKLILSLANAYRLASLEERFKFIDQAGVLRVGNPNLKPEKGLFSNFSYSVAGKKVLLKADVFSNYLFDLITEELGTYSYGNGNQVQAWVNSNVDQAFYYGGELELKWLIADRLMLETFVSYVNGVNAQTGDVLPLVPPMRGLASLQYNIDRLMNVSVAVDWEYELEDVHDSLTEPHRHAIFKLILESEKFKRGALSYQLMGGIHNIFNTAYQEHFSTLRGISRLEPGRNFYVRAIVNW